MNNRSSTQWRCTIGRKVVALGALAILVAASSTMRAAEPQADAKRNLSAFDTGKPAQTPVSDLRAPEVVLYDQTTSLGAGATSQNFEAIYDVYDNQAADDFVTTGAGWSITTVTAPGTYSTGGGPATTAGVQFYADAGGLPGALLCDYPSVPNTGTATFTLILPAPCVIPGGTHAWVSVFANLSATTNGQWFWATRSVLAGSPAAWQNPGDGFGTTCTTWSVRGGCLGSSASPDQGFRLNGDALPCAVNGDCNDSNPCTDDVCNVGVGCEYTNNTASCSDGNGCTTGDTCSGGVCNPGGPTVCDDGLFCTIDSCDTGSGNCVAVPGACNDNNSCTFDSCDEATDTCSYYSPPAVEFCNPTVIVIPATLGPASPYPSAIPVAGLPANSAVCTVRLNNITHTWSDDIDVLLSGPNPGNAIVMSDVGGGTDVINATVLLTDGAAASMPDGPSLVSGTYKPTNIGAGDTFNAPAPAPQGGSALGAFGQGNQNGTWNLWVRDDFAQDAGTINGWCVGFVRETCANDSECTDGNPCNGLETCVSSRCEPGTPINCDDALFCTLDSCNTTTGACEYAPNTCDDTNSCTDDLCVEGTGCVSTNNTGACDDGSICTSGDTCADGACVGTNACVQLCSTDPISIPDGGPATPYPSSIAVSGVIYPAAVVSVELRGLSHQFPDDLDILLVGPVDDSQNAILMSDAGGGADVVGINLTFSDAAATAISNSGPLASGTFRPANYDGGTDPDPFPAPAPPWSGSTTISTFSGNPNGTFDLFVLDEFAGDGGSLDGWCLNILQIGCSDSSECDDANFCTADECVNGGCQSVFSTAPCDDFNPCTNETCSPDNGCGYEPNTCDDNNLCTADSCTDPGGCNNVVTVICDDGDPSTTDTCDPGTGNCVYTVSCDDGDPCTSDTFDSGTSQCVFTPIVCDDGVYCNGAETCVAGACVAGSPVTCDDGVACTADSCVEATDSCANVPNNAACDDGNVCTDDVCTATGCAYSNNTAPCDDGADCTSGDTCQSGVCAGNTSQPNPKTKGFYKKACKNNQITAADAACVAQTAPLTFGDTDTVAEVCDELNGHDSDLPGHDTDEKHCTKDETELLVAALNVCTGRVCEAQPINSHDSDTSNDPDPATVGEAIDEADQIFGDPDRTKLTCHNGKDLVKDINNGKALEMNTLVLAKSGDGVQLTWTPPYIGDDQSVIHYEVWRSIRGADAWVLIRTQTSTSYVDNTAGEFEYEVLVDIHD